nr:TPA_asm: hypothetical protein HUJ06_025581 [Nelumbo nucifera]
MDSFTGIFTRSRSEIFLHRNRSGRARSDSKCRNNHIEVEWPNWTRINPRLSNEEAFDNEIARISIKDLRTRRVFSPASIPVECYSDETVDSEEIEDAEKPKLSDNGGAEALSVEASHSEQKNDRDGEISCRGDAPTEDCIQTTPPDTDVFCRSEVDETEGNTIGFEIQSADCSSENPSNRKISDRDCYAGERFFRVEKDKNNQPNARSRMEGLVPCSRLRLFKTPSSFSYRRLLPFLMDLAKDNSNALEIHPCQKVEKAEERLLPISVTKSRDILLNGTNAEKFPMEHHFDDLRVTPTIKSSESTPSTGSSEVEHSNLVSIQQPIIEPHLQISPDTPLVSPVCGSMIKITPDSYSECTPKVQQVIPDGSSRLEPGHHAVDSIHETDQVNNSSHSSVCPEASTIDKGALEVPSCLPSEVEDGFVTPLPNLITDMNPVAAVSIHQDSSGVGKLKGILKRNPRGCRGLCTCLNCSSFRLHAERAFEFSRNQMQDAEEVTAYLMKELSCLRNLLEKCIDDSKDQAVLQVSQVQEACSKASEAEGLAKCQLMQMRQDLNIHCRMTCLQRPRVNFVNSSEVKPSQSIGAFQSKSKSENSG